MAFLLSRREGKPLPYKYCFLSGVGARKTPSRREPPDSFKNFRQPLPESGGCCGKTGRFSQPVHRIFHRFSNFLLLFPRFSTSAIFHRICSFRSLFSPRQSDFHGSMLLSSPVFEKFRSASVSEKAVSFFKPLCRYRLQAERASM